MKVRLPCTVVRCRDKEEQQRSSDPWITFRVFAEVKAPRVSMPLNAELMTVFITGSGGTGLAVATSVYREDGSIVYSRTAAGGRPGFGRTSPRRVARTLKSVTR